MNYCENCSSLLEKCQSRLGKQGAGAIFLSITLSIITDRKHKLEEQNTTSYIHVHSNHLEHVPEPRPWNQEHTGPNPEAIDVYSFYSGKYQVRVLSTKGENFPPKISLHSSTTPSQYPNLE